jgi:MFS family permease
MAMRARDEWRHYWTLAIAAALGNSVSVLHIYSLGPFMEPLNQDFGWSRAQVSLGITIANGIGALMYVFVGMLIDRWGPRRVGLIGVTYKCSVFALLATANGDLSNWIMLWVLVAIGTAWVQPTIWTGAVASRFDTSRGVGIAITISGSGIAASVIPILATWLIANYGWRSGFAGLAIIWAIMVLPFIALFFRGAQDQRKQPHSSTRPLVGDSLPGYTLAQGLRSPSFYRLAISGMFFAFAIIGLIVHFVPVLRDRGLDPLTAAGIAGILGISSILGRLGTGFLLDRFRADRVAMAAFLLPAIAATLLLGSSQPFSLGVAAFVTGLSLGSELDVVLYLSTRHFGLKRFGALFGSMLVALALGTGLGPVAAGATFDHFGSYSNFILLIYPLVISGALLVGTLGPYPDHARNIGAP